MPDIEPTKTNEQQPQEQKTNISSWKKKFESSEKIMKSDFRPKWLLARKRVRAEYDVKNKNTAKMTHGGVNLAYSVGNSFVNSVYFKAPNCNLTAREEIDHDRIENTEIATNDWLKDNAIKRVIRRIIWDAYDGGFGARFIDHEYDDVEDPNNILQPAQIDPITGQEIAPPVFGRIVLKNKITMQRIRPDLVRFPKGFDFDNYQESPWIGFDVIMPIDEVKNNEKWDINVRQMVEGEKYEKLSDGDSSKNSNSSEGDDLYAKISFCFSKPESPLEKFKLLVFCHKYEESPLQEIEFDKGHVGYPVKFMYFNPLDDDCSYPVGDLWLFESQLNVIDTWWHKMSRHVERSNPKTVYDSGTVSRQEVQNLKSGNDLEFIGLENKQKRPLSDLILEMQRAPVHPDVTKLYEVARQLLSEIAPRSGLTRGSTDNEVDTATEAKIIQTGEVIDIEARVDVIKDFIADIVLDVAGILEKSMTAPIPVKKPIMQPIVGPDGVPSGEMEESGEEEILEVNKTGFTSKINVDVDVESMQAQNKDVLFRQLVDFLQFLVKFEPIMNKTGKTLEPLFWLERIMETRNIRNIEKGIVDLPPMPVPIGPDGHPLPIPGNPGVSRETISDGTGMEVQEDAMAARV